MASIAEMSIAIGLKNWDQQVSVIGLGEESRSYKCARKAGFEPDDDDDDGYDYAPAA